MATKKDLVEAYSFSRRRLVTAFVSGAPGGREVEPARPGRAVIGGIALAVLLLAAAAIVNLLGNPGEIDGEKTQLLSEKESGADYILIASPGSDDLLLRPVINITSSMLLLDAGAEPAVFAREKLNELTAGPPIGILQAPTTPPPADKLIDSGWTACTGQVDGQPVGIKINVSASPGVVETPGVSFVVRAVSTDVDDPDAPPEPGPLYLIAMSASDTDDGVARAYAYEVPEKGGRADAVLGAVAASSVPQATEVPASWVSTFPAGGALDLSTFGLSARQVGRAFPGAEASPSLRGAEVGDVLMVGDRSYLLLPTGTAVLLDDFSREVYLGVAPDGRAPIPSDAQPPLADPQALTRLLGASWPSVTTDAQPSGELCSILRAAPGRAPYAVLGRAVPGDDASAEDVDAGRRVSVVDAGAGAFVRSGGWQDEESSTRVLVDDLGSAYGVAGETEAQRLGYGGEPAEVVPDSWLELFDRGVLLSVDAARCPPTSRERTEPCE